MVQLELDTQHALQIIPSDMTDEEFFRFCMMNKNVRIERDKDRNVIVMPPIFYHSGNQESEIATDVKNYARKYGGDAPSPSTGYTLPSGAVRMADAAWVSPERVAQLSNDEKWQFAPVVPDFVAEVRSSSDRLNTLKDKMLEWIENGVRLAWLIDPKTETAYIYRENGDIETLKGFVQILNGEDVIKGFEFDLKLIKKHK